MTSRTSDWPGERTEATDLLRALIADSTSMASLLASRERVLAGLASTIDVSDLDSAIGVLGDISGMFGWLDEMITDEEISDELADRFLWDVGWGLVEQMATTALRLTGIGGIEKKGTNIVVRASIGRLRTLLESQGVWNAPAPESVTIADGRQRRDWRRTTLAAAVVTGMWDAMRANGDPVGTMAPPPPPPPPSSGDDTCISDDWLHDVETWTSHVDDETSRRTIELAVAIMLNPGQATAACADISSD